MRSLTQIVGSAGLAFAIAAWASAGGPPQTQSFVDFCAYVGSNFTNGHWLGAYCRNNLTEVFGYNYSWYVFGQRILGIWSGPGAN